MRGRYYKMEIAWVHEGILDKMMNINCKKMIGLESSYILI